MSNIYKLVFTLFICAWSNLLCAQGDKLGCLNQIDKHVLSTNELTLESCGLGDEDMAQIAFFMQNNPSIDSLVLDNNDEITSKGLAILFKNNPHINSLHATGCNIDDEGAYIIATLSTLESLYLGDSQGMTINGINALSSLHKLEWLDLSNSNIDDESAIVLSKLTTLRALYLDENLISSVGASAIETLPNLSMLSINQNYIGNAGAIALSKHKYFYDLELDANHIGDDGAIALASNVDIDMLSMMHDDLSDKSAIAFANSKHKINDLDLGYNLISEKGIAMLKDNPKFLSVDLKGNFTQ